MTRASIAAAAVAALLVGCPKQHIARTCGHPPHQAACVGAIDVPAAYARLVTDGASQAIEVLHDPSYRAEVERFIADHGQDPDLAAQWGRATADELIARMQSELGTLKITTFGGPVGLTLLLARGTKAYERASPHDPIRLNRWALRTATSAAVANTIVHELAHAIGLRHPHSSGPDENWSIAHCEPPYVLGSVAEKVVQGDAWRRTSGDCDRLAP